MMMEEQLRMTLERASTDGPPPPVDLLERVESGHRRRRRNRQAGWSAVAGVAALAVAGAAVLLPRPTTDPVVSTTPTPTPSPSVHEPAAKDAPRADVVWPQAVIEIPAKFGAGANEPITMLDEHRMLLAVRVSADKVVSLAVYDARNRTEKVLTDLPDPPGVRGYWPGAFTAGDGMIVWTAYAYGKDGSQTTEYWTMRDDGTGKRRSLQASVGERVIVVDGTLYGSDVNRGGIKRMPVTGGTPQKVAGSEGFEITSWPWAVSAAPMGTDDPVAWNLVTGERRTPKQRPQPTRWWTVADQDVWLGLDHNGLTFAQATDGSWQVTTSWFDARSINGGRFVAGNVKNWLHPNDPKPRALWDLRTGLVGTYEDGGDSFRQQVAHPLAWVTDGDRLKVIDPARI
ncbi:hypothetical protein [Dactylosporangium sp. NPDC005555]|uniref:hypothetical protein n=1 Tax=Dactylosporangium sp. NPDC005555 TaxID=3154889 RepID=UPI0033AA7EE6